MPIGLLLTMSQTRRRGNVSPRPEKAKSSERDTRQHEEIEHATMWADGTESVKELALLSRGKPHPNGLALSDR